jgi:HK97 gp10 family phage protein
VSQSSFSFELTGMKELLNLLDQLPTVAMQKGVVRNALKKAGTPIAEMAKDLAPDSGEQHKQKLKESIKVSTSIKASQKRGRISDRSSVTVYVGSSAPHAHLVEFGTGPRTQKNGRFTGQMPPNPFMRTAWDTLKMNALKIFSDEMKNEIYKAARRLAKKAAKGTLTQRQIEGLNR